MKQIKRFGVLQTAKVVAVFYLIITAIFCVPFGLISLGGTSRVMPRGGIFFIFAPLLYGVLGFIFTAISCLIYNFIASKIGGIEIEI